VARVQGVYLSDERNNNMHTTALAKPQTVPPWQKPTSVIRVLPRARPESRRGPGAAVTNPQSRWTVIAAFVLAVILHVAPVAILEMKLDTPRVEITEALNKDTSATTAD
jgi:hypothetical protein